MGRNRSQLPELGLLYNIFNVCGDRLKAFLPTSHLESQYTCCVLLHIQERQHSKSQAQLDKFGIIKGATPAFPLPAVIVSQV